MAGPDNREFSHNHLRVHPPVNIGGRTFSFSANWREIGYGGGDQKGKATGTYEAFPRLGVDEKGVIRFPNGTGMLVVGGNSRNADNTTNTNGYSRGAVRLSREDVAFMASHGISIRDGNPLNTSVTPRTDIPHEGGQQRRTPAAAQHAPTAAPQAAPRQRTSKPKDDGVRVITILP